MPFPDSFLDELRARCDIADVVSDYVQLKPKGANMFGLCPFHSEKTPSFSVNQDKQIYHCFGCGKGGGVVGFIMEIENLSYPDAVHFLAKRAGLTVPESGASPDRERRSRILALNREAARYYCRVLREPAGTAVAEYAEKRRLTRQTLTRFGLGAAPDRWDALITEMAKQGYSTGDLIDAGLAVRSSKGGGFYDKFRNRLIFPVIDVRGDVVGFGSRVLDKSEPKYLNSPETVAFSKRRVLYAMNFAKSSKRSGIILCEGNIDVVTLHQAGFDNAVASMGTSLTPEHVQLLTRYAKELTLCFDNDEAGKKATTRALSMLTDAQFTVKVLQLPQRREGDAYVKCDADDYIRLYGAPAFETLLSGSEGQMEFRLQAVAAKYDLKADAERVACLKELAELLASLKSPVEREVYGGRAADLVGISHDAFKLEIENVRKAKAAKSKRDYEREALHPSRTAQPKERERRYTDVPSALAEEGVICLLLADSELIGKTGELSEEDFSSPMLRKIYALLRRRDSAGESVELSAVADALEPDEAAHLVKLTQRPVSLSNAAQALGDYISAIRTARLKERLDLNAISSKYRESKGYRG